MSAGFKTIMSDTEDDFPCYVRNNLEGMDFYILSLLAVLGFVRYMLSYNADFHKNVAVSQFKYTLSVVIPTFLALIVSRTILTKLLMDVMCDTRVWLFPAFISYLVLIFWRDINGQKEQERMFPTVGVGRYRFDMRLLIFVGCLLPIVFFMFNGTHEWGLPTFLDQEFPVSIGTSVFYMIILFIAYRYHCVVYTDHKITKLNLILALSLCCFFVVIFPLSQGIQEILTARSIRSSRSINVPIHEVFDEKEIQNEDKKFLNVRSK